MSPQTAFWLDGTPTSVLPLPDRGVEFGDGLFETLLLKQGIPLFLETHLDRLGQGLHALGLPDCLNTARQQVITAAITADKENWNWAVLRLTVTRGPGARGYTPSQTADPRIVISISPLNRNCAQLPSAATLGVAEIRLSAQPFLARIKHLNRLEQVLAAAQAQAKGTDECIVLDQAGHVISVVAGNLFLVHSGELLTPALVDCGILGTRRRLTIEKWAPLMGVKVRETRLTLSEIKNAEEVFYTNSLQGFRPVARLGDRCWDNHGMCEALFQKYLDDLP